MTGSAAKRFNDYASSVHSTMIRDIDGNIIFWNRAAEKNYGFKRAQVVGQVSHHILNTIFPCPLAEINDRLLNNGVWEGELIHTLSDGARVKVRSRWEIVKDRTVGELHVKEVNNPLRSLNPDTAFLTPQLTPSELLTRTVLRMKWWFIGPLVFVSLLMLSAILLTAGLEVVPLLN